MFTLLTGLTKYFPNLTAIVTMADDGGSTGLLREDFGILPPGDVRRALVALSKTDNKMLAELFSYRFREGSGLRGHSFGNLMLTALERLTGSFEKAIQEAAKILSAEGQVVPVTLMKARLCAELENGEKIKGETNIDVPRHDGNIRIKKAWLAPQAVINPNAKKAILNADLIVIGPGDLYTSIVPNLLVRGVPEALGKTKARVAYFANLMTKFGETNNFSASDFLKVMEEYCGKGVVDYVVVNSNKPSSSRLAPYVAEHASWVVLDKQNFKGKPTLITADLLRPRGFIRHDPEKTAQIIRRLV